TTYNCHEGAVPFLKTYVIRPLFNAFLMSPKPFQATEACTACKRCEKKCPVHNIKVDGKPQWGDRCTQCLACYHGCPVKAVQYGKRTKGKGQYKGEHLK
ncbi:MAG: EFR1 family ferrodoxin, partial [Bacteroidaceae bacterium]|nr:EFR1 family ferrodoxin [Bacteroidaceae bacterium]